MDVNVLNKYSEGFLGLSQSISVLKVSTFRSKIEKKKKLKHTSNMDNCFQMIKQIIKSIKIVMVTCFYYFKILCQAKPL